MGLAHRVARMAALTAISLMLLPTVVQAEGEPPIRDAWLRDYLPDDVLLYARIPHPFGLLTAPKGNTLDAALRSDANLATVAKIREGISANVLPRIPMFQDVRLRLLEKHLQSPIELAVLPLPAPSLLISANIDVASNEDFESLFEEIAAEEASMRLVAPLDELGTGQLEGLGQQRHVQRRQHIGRHHRAADHVDSEEPALVARAVEHRAPQG